MLICRIRVEKNIVFALSSRSHYEYYMKQHRAAQYLLGSSQKRNVIYYSDGISAIKGPLSKFRSLYIIIIIIIFPFVPYAFFAPPRRVSFYILV